MNRCHVVILGAGPSGLGAAYRLRKEGKADVTVLERSSTAGGLAGGFTIDGLHADFGSHRLHPSCDPVILADIRAQLGADLLDRPRHGRIRLRGRWIHFPLNPLDLLLRLPWGFALGTAVDVAKKAWRFRHKPQANESFATILLKGLGPTICRDFYFPYARKIWGIAPEELSAIQAQRRVQAGSPGKLFKKIVAAVPGLKPKGAGRFYYPRRGFGQIAQGYLKAARDQGANFTFGASVETIRVTSDDCAVTYRLGDELRQVSADYVWSTIPVTSLVRSLRPEALGDVLEATRRIRYRSMILIYLQLAQDRFSEYDAHYFPELHIPITRLSEPRNYSNVDEPRGRDDSLCRAPMRAR